jgi:DNA-binding MarR family transcriptional regulator
MNGDAQHLFRPLISLLGRSVFPHHDLVEIVTPLKGMEKQVKAFNLCDGSRSQAEIGKQLKLDAGNFSRTVSRWIEAGVVFRLGEGRDARLLHVYPLTQNGNKGGHKKK